MSGHDDDRRFASEVTADSRGVTMPIRPRHAFTESSTDENVAPRISRSWSLRTRLIINIGVFLATLGFLLPPSLFGITVFDEGFIVTGAMQVLHGKLPYRDFTSLYGPGQFYLVAAAFALFGERLVVAHIVHAVLLASLAVLVYNLSASATYRRTLPFVMVFAYLGIVLYADASVLYPAISGTIVLLVSALMMRTWLRDQRTWMLVASSALIGIAGIVRWDFGLSALIALAVTQVVVVRERQRHAQWTKLAVCTMAPALSILAVVYIPLVMFLSDPLRWYEEVLRYSVAEFPKWRSREYARPAIWTLVSAWHHGDASRFSEAVVQLAYLLLPLTSALAILLLTVVRLARRKDIQRDRAFAQSIFLSLLTLFLLNQMRVRPTAWQGLPAAVTCLPLLAYLHGLLPRRGSLAGGVRAASAFAAFALGALLFNPALHHWMRAIDHRAIELETHRAAGVRLGRDWQYYGELINYVRSQTSEGEAIYSGVSDHSRLFVNDPMLYFLSNRPPADRFVELEPGIANIATAQHEIVKSLRDKAVRIIVLWDIASNESNLTAVSNGIHHVDTFIDENYRPLAQFGPYTVKQRI